MFFANMAWFISGRLRLWATSTAHLGHDLPIISPIKSVTLTHLHLGHIDGIGLFGREVMGAPTESIRLISGKPVIDEIEKKSYLQPFAPEVISNGSRVELGPGVALEFHRVPHRDHECGETYGVIVRGEQKSILFLPDHDTYEETLNYHDKTSVREWLKSLDIDVALIDGTFFTVEEIAGRRSDSKTIPHPTISETLKLLGQRTNDDPDVIFIHINHTNPILDDEMKSLEVEQLGWKIGTQGQTWII